MKIILFANTDWYLYNYRLSLAQELASNGNDVLFLSPPGNYGKHLEDAGFRWIQFPLSRRGMNPFQELLTINRLANLYKQEAPDVVHHFTVKCVLYGSVAARFASVKKIINAITGLGYLYEQKGVKTRILRPVINLFYRYALRNTWVIFQNPDDMKMFHENQLVDLKHSLLIRSSGVHVNRFHLTPEEKGPPIVMLAARMLWPKGIGEFVEAARLLKSQGVDARFVLVGDTYPDNPRSVTAEKLASWEAEGTVEWWGWHDDMEKMMQSAHIVCLPTYYREGVPRSLVEAAASGRPIIATDVSGCREIVRNGLNGFLIPPKNPAALAEAMKKLIEQPLMRAEMGRNGRLLVEEEFSDQKVIAETLQLYN